MADSYDTRTDNSVKWVLRCPICLSDRNDIYLGGKIARQLYKCLDCEYIGSAFIEVDSRWTPSMDVDRSEVNE
jgi:hypothetical protein